MNVSINYALFETSQSTELSAMFAQSFSDSEGEAEGKLIGNLVDDLLVKTPSNDIHVFTALQDKQVIAGIVFTRFFTEQNTSFFMLSPVAVATAFQGKGIGQALLNFGISQMKDNKADVLITYGDPNYYQKVGFSAISQDIIPAPFELSQPHGWLAQSLTETPITKITGSTRCVEAFQDPKYW